MKSLKIIKAPYICTIPSGGLRDIQCFPDAITFFSGGKKYGFSKKAWTLIAPLDATMSEVIEAHKQYDKYNLHMVTHRRRMM